MANPYHSISEDDEGALEAQWYIREIQNLQPRDPKAFRSGASHYYVRDHVARRLCWCIPNERWVKNMLKIVRGKRVLELAAGTGFIASIFQERGVDWLPTDIEPAGQVHTSIEELSGQAAIDKYLGSRDIVFWSWWPYEDELDDLYALNAVMRDNKTIVMVGEGRGGCTGSAGFWKEASTSAEITYPCDWDGDVLVWPGMRDHTHIVRRKEDE